MPAELPRIIAEDRVSGVDALKPRKKRFDRGKMKMPAAMAS
jgi:hypothetical protein